MLSRPNRLAHELLQQQLAGRFERGVGEQQLETAAAVLHIDPQSRDDRRVRQPGDGREAWVHLEPLE